MTRTRISIALLTLLAGAAVLTVTTIVTVLFADTTPAKILTEVLPAKAIEKVAEVLVPTKSPTRAGLPIRLLIPKIGVATTLEYVGLTPLGAMDVPKGPANAAWFDLGARPGEAGSAVIAGHFGWKNGIPAVFDDLHTLAKGDKLLIEDATGTTTTFIVREVRTFGENDDAAEVFLSDDGIAHLNLITCEGIWNAAAKSYAGRLVVFADKEI